MECGRELSLLTGVVRVPIYSLIFIPSILCAQVYLTKEEVLKIYFPGSAASQRKTVFLTDEQVKNIQEKSKARVESKIVTYYVGRDSSGNAGYAFFETQTIRTMPATYVVVVNADTSLRAVEILAFYEPEDYLPSKKWLAQFTNKNPRSDLWLKRGIHNMVGATLSAQALSDGVRRILATFEV
ncbi:MAG: FMN-binding protein, partial [Ignavibacteriales bacterium]|nr:FMN-binding protein [Ignavibacteriales bacterium]